MDFFSYQYQSSLFDSVYPPNLPMKLTSSLEGDIGSFSLLHYPSSSLHASISTEHCMTSPITENQFSSVPLVENHTLSYSSGCNFAQQKNGTDNKRKNRDDKDAKEAQRKKQWKYNTSSRDSGEKLKPENNQKKSSDEPPSGYIHVRARRGQATDNHSLAERVRREKISQRMKLLQGLVPGCDKVTGKALMLDEIINYVQSLQNQVKFLSMKLASFCPDFFDFGADSEGHMPQSETRGSLPSQSQSVQQNPQLENATSALAHGQTPVNSAFPQDNANLLLEGERQVEGFLTRDNFNDSCYF